MLAAVLRGAQWPVVVLMVCVGLSAVRGAACPPRCLCTADILSCPALDLDRVPAALPAAAAILDLSHNRVQQLEPGGFQGLLQLEVLRLANNQLIAIQPGAFRNSSGRLRHLDLSSNQLTMLNQSNFQELAALEELLLFNNRIQHVESTALSGLTGLRKAYLSHNRLTDFPFFSIQTGGHRQLTLLDLSSNRLPKLPLADISGLPPALQEALYLHNNSLVCDCDMFALFQLWEQKGFASVRFFRQEHVCQVPGVQRNGISFILHRSYFESCNVTAAPQQEASVSVRVGAPLLLHCITSLSGRAAAFFWLTPQLEYVAPPGNNGSIRMFANGSLVMAAPQERDSGIYVCVAKERRLNDSREVNVTVLPRPATDAAEPFNTGFTTLLGCVVSLLLVLVYLYLTPCRCPPRPGPRPLAATAHSQGKEGGAGSAQSSILTPTPPASTEGPGRKVSSNKHVVFLEPIREQQNGRLGAEPPQRAGGAEPPQRAGGVEPPQRAGGAEPPQRAGETDSYMSVFSDTPILLPERQDSQRDGTAPHHFLHDTSSPHQLQVQF